MTRLASTMSKLRRLMGSWPAGIINRQMLGCLTTSVLVLTAGHSVVARPWGDHQDEAQVIAQAAACAAASELLYGGSNRSAMAEAAEAAVLAGFRGVHGHDFFVDPVRFRQGTGDDTFTVRVAITHKKAHYLLEAVTGNDSPWVIEAAFIDDANFHQCQDVKSP